MEENELFKLLIEAYIKGDVDKLNKLMSDIKSNE